MMVWSIDRFEAARLSCLPKMELTLQELDREQIAESDFHVSSFFRLSAKSNSTMLPVSSNPLIDLNKSTMNITLRGHLAT